MKAVISSAQEAYVNVLTELARPTAAVTSIVQGAGLLSSLVFAGCKTGIGRRVATQLVQHYGDLPNKEGMGEEESTTCL